MIYLLTRLDEVGYDEYDSVAVRAENEQQARSIATRYMDSQIPEKVSCDLIHPEGSPAIILTSFKAG